MAQCALAHNVKTECNSSSVVKKRLIQEKLVKLEVPDLG